MESSIRRSSPGIDDNESTLDFQMQLGPLTSYATISLVISDDTNNNTNKGIIINSYSFNPNESMAIFLTQASKALDMIPLATHAYSSKGILLTDCLMIDNGDTVCLSHGQRTSSLVLQPKDADKSMHDDRLSLVKDKLPNKIESYVVSPLMGIDTLGRQLCIGTGEISGAQVRYPFTMISHENIAYILLVNQSITPTTASITTRYHSNSLLVLATKNY